MSGLVELRGFEPLTFSLRTRRATNCATAPGAPVAAPRGTVADASRKVSSRLRRSRIGAGPSRNRTGAQARRTASTRSRAQGGVASPHPGEDRHQRAPDRVGCRVQSRPIRTPSGSGRDRPDAVHARGQRLEGARGPVEGVGEVERRVHRGQGLAQRAAVGEHDRRDSADRAPGTRPGRGPRGSERSASARRSNRVGSGAGINASKACSAVDAADEPRSAEVIAHRDYARVVGQDPTTRRPSPPSRCERWARSASSASRASALSDSDRPDDHTPVSSRSMVRTVRRAAGLETYVGSVTGSGSHTSGSACRRRPRRRAGPPAARPWCPRAVESLSPRRRPRPRAPRPEPRGRPAWPSPDGPADASLGADHQPAGDQPGDQQGGGRGGPPPADQVEGGDADDRDVGQQQQPEHAPATTRGPGDGLAAGARVGDRRALRGDHRRGGRPARGHDQPGVATVDGLASREHPHPVREPVDRPAADDLVVVLERLRDQVGGPGDREGHEDESAEFHASEVRSARRTRAVQAGQCVAKQLL